MLDNARGRVSKPKRTRVNFTPSQLEAMEKVFSNTQYPDVTILERLAEQMNLGIEKVCTWFQNRRSKFRRESKKGHIDWMRQQLFTGNGEDDATAVAPPRQNSDRQSPEHVLSNVRPPVTSACDFRPDIMSSNNFIPVDMMRAGGVGTATKRLDNIPLHPQTSTMSDCFSKNHDYAAMTSAMTPVITSPMMTAMGYHRYPYTPPTSSPNAPRMNIPQGEYTNAPYTAEASWSCGQYYAQPQSFSDYTSVQPTTASVTSYAPTSGHYDSRMYNTSPTQHYSNL